MRTSHQAGRDIPPALGDQLGGKKVAEDPAASEERCALFMDALPAAAFIKDGDGSILYVNPCLAALAGGEAWLGQAAPGAFPPELGERILADDRRALAAGPLVVEESLPSPEGPPRRYQMHRFAIARQGKPPLLGGIALDISARQQAEDRLRAARAAAEQANHARSRFLAATSHDLRQPLSAISLHLGMLKAIVPPGSQEILEHIHECLGDLNERLTDLLDVSKLDAGVVTPRPSALSVDKLVRHLVALHSAAAEEKGLKLRWRASGAMAHTDPQLLQRILGNLLSNAIRYTERGGVLIACRRQRGKRWIEVRDTGIGIADDQTGIVFEEFRQLGNAAPGRGSGLGLAIVARSAALLKLEIRLRSRPGRGSMFAVELPQ